MNSMTTLLKRAIQATGFEIRRAGGGGRASDAIHFLHIGKNAGTQIKNIAKQVNAMSPSRQVVKRRHDVFLRNLPEGADYFFSIRDPISRFKSGFYTRKRKGQPRLYSEWTDDDALAFAEFDHANELAESLFAPGETGHRAWAAMKSIRHTAQDQSDWFYTRGNFLRTRPPIWIVRQEAFEADMRTFLARAGLGVDAEAIDFVGDAVSAHRGDYAGIPPLSERARENLRVWYAQDLAFVAACTAWIEAGGRA
jgi:hypothetical protein